MSDAFKNRLIGTIILVALAVIFLPQILDGEKQIAQERFADVPDAAPALDIPEMPPVDISAIKTKTERPVKLEELEPQDQEYLEAQTSTDELDSSAPVPDAEGAKELAADLGQTDNDTSTSSNAPENLTAVPLEELEIEVKQAGWVIQLGVFSEQSNARNVIKTVTNAGYRAYSQPVRTSSGTVTKVLVGPELDKANLEKALPHLKELTRLSGKIIEYEVSAE